MPQESPIRHANERRAPPWLAASLSLALLGAATTAGGFGNAFVQDELPLILKNRTIHALSAPASFFTQPYWHDPFPPALYRPLATTAHAVQWKLGGGSPRPFRWVSAALLIGAGLTLYGLGCLLLPPWGAWIAAALFVVHPLHVEATALAINQGELVVGLMLCLATALYVRARNSRGFSPGTIAALALCYLVAMLFKENGLVMPGLFLAAELTVIADTRPWRTRIKELRPLYLLLALVLALVVAVRTLVLGGDSVGTPPAEALTGTGPVGRALTMLAVVPEWFRLLFWPAHLQADYGPREIAAATGWRVNQWIGAGVLLAWGTAALWSRRRAPAFAFALLWIGVAVLPVSNVLVPTGIALAERTLFLASAGATLALGTLASLPWPSRRLAMPMRWVAGTGVAILLALGLIRSTSRAQIWRTQESLLEHTVVDAPRSYGAHLALGRFLDDSGKTSLAEPHFREAAALNPGLPDRERRLGDQFRLNGLCRPAVRHYRLPLAARPEDVVVRASSVACLLHLGRFEEARVTAEPGLNDPRSRAYFERAIRTADSALATQH